MENKRKVRNYVVTNKEMFCDALARALCQMNISYVQVENEFHFNNIIYRFYNSFEFMELQASIIFEKIEEEKVKVLDPRSLVLMGNDMENVLLAKEKLVVTPPEIKFDNRKNNFHSKQMIKNNNRMVKQKLKDNYNQQGYRASKVNLF